MPNRALYVYGIVKFGLDLDWKESGLNGKKVYAINEGGFSALVHDCEEKAYSAEEPDKIKELIITHNNVLNKAMEDFGGAIPLSFNTIIKKSANSAQCNLKKWLNDEKGRLGKIWDKIKGHKEYGLRVYYERDKLVQKASENTKMVQTGKGSGLNYLLREKAKSKVNEIVQNRIVQLKQKFYNNINKITKDVKINNSRVLIDEEKDLLLSLSVLANEQKIGEIKESLEGGGCNGLSFQLVGPFAPYSFVENEKH